MTTDYKHPDYERFQPLWHKVRTCCAGEDAVKGAGELYLPRPDEGRRTTEARRRYARYLHRSVFYNATGRTLQGLVGVAFSNWPTVKLPRGADYLFNDVDGTGLSLVNQAQRAVSDVLQTGRAGLLADCTATDETERKRPRSVADAEKAGWRMYLTLYAAEDILTWELEDGKLSRLVLQETHRDYGEGKTQEVPQLRELVMVDGVCEVIIWRKYSESGDYKRVSKVETSHKSIPFHFIGAVDNSPCPDFPPLLDLANLNLAHFRNSADFEESAFLMGQPMLAITGVTEEWVEQRGEVHIGARAALSLPEGGDAKFIQPQPNTLAKEAMDDKERMMAALGARLLTPGSAPMTATQSAAETKSAYSQLSLTCDCVSEAYRAALGSLAMLLSYGRDEVDFAIDTRFNDLMLDANAIQATVQAWQEGLVPQSDAWGVLRRLGVIDQAKTDEELAMELEELQAAYGGM